MCVEELRDVLRITRKETISTQNNLLTKDTLIINLFIGNISTGVVQSTHLIYFSIVQRSIVRKCLGTRETV